MPYAYIVSEPNIHDGIQCITLISTVCIMCVCSFQTVRGGLC